MVYFSIRVNDSNAWTIGGPDVTQAGLYIGNSQESKVGHVASRASRYAGNFTTEDIEWPMVSLRIGDVVTVSVETTGPTSPPSHINAYDTSPQKEIDEQSLAKLIAQARLYGKGPRRALTPKALDESSYFCSFCGKHESEVQSLLEGVAVFICDECVSSCVVLIAEKSKP